MRDMCLRLEAEVAKLRNLLASAHGTGTGTESQTGTGPSLGSGASAGAGTPIAGCGGFLSGFSGGGGGDGGGGGGHGQGLPRMSHMVGSFVDFLERAGEGGGAGRRRVRGFGECSARC